MEQTIQRKLQNILWKILGKNSYNKQQKLCKFHDIRAHGSRVLVGQTFFSSNIIVKYNVDTLPG